MRKVMLLIIVLAVITAGWFLYFHKPDQITQVSVGTAKMMDLSNTLEFSGQVTPVNMYSVMSETGGTVSALHVLEGDAVKKGDKLFTLDASDIKRQLEQAQLQLDALENAQTQAVMAQNGSFSEAERSLQEQQIKVALALAQTTGYDFESFNEAFAGAAQDAAAEMASSLSGLTLTDLSDTAVADPGSSSQLALAQLTVEGLQAAIDKMSFFSLIDGTVLAVNIHKGEVLSPGIPALIVADTEETVIEGYVYEKDVSSLAESQQVKIYTEEGYYWGTLTGIGKAAGGIGETSTYGSMAKVQISPGSGFKKIPGAVVDLEIIISGRENVLAVPLDCITDDGCVFVVSAEGIAEKRIVRTGFSDMYYTEIKSGVSAGEVVILSPKGIEEGQRVAYD
jgi:multidrug efflux pump subunit AcrA (membrane-fusion protein)